MASVVKYYLNLGNNLKRFREMHKENQTEFSKRLGISRSTYSNYENNNRFPDDTALKSIAEKLGIKVSDLLGVESELMTFESGKAFDEYRKKLINGEVIPEKKTTEEITIENLETNILKSILELNYDGLIKVKNYIVDLISTGKYKRDKINKK